MDLLHQLLDVVLHLDVYLNQWAADLGPWLYVLLFAIVFCETGLVVTPFLPGDSLLFAVGALSATPDSVIRPVPVALVLIAAALCGDLVNYTIGRKLGPRMFKSDGSRLFNRKHLERTQHFYEKHGGKTIILARFVPIVRTFAPFVAGVGKMEFRRYATFCVVGAVVWVGLIVTAGCVFGNLEPVKRNFHLVIIGIIVISVLPAVIEVLRNRGKGK
ncbi:MAG: DedA family protein [Planctomycetes bacterium]|nr:DedA family protein [Planctomycetota bacterium]